MSDDAVAHIKSRTGVSPRIGVVLGSGLGAFADELTDSVAIPYAEIPGWPASTAVGHAGALVIGRIGAADVAVMAGRSHLYEGYTPAQVTYGVRVLGRLSVRSMIFTNAAGGINLGYSPGNLVLIADHINLQGLTPLSGPRFLDMSEAYSGEYRAMAREAARGLGFDLQEGVYAALPGPSYETPAEIRYLRIIGADLVGMSTVLEVIAANDLGMRVLAISCVTNMAAGILPQKINHEEVLETGRQVRDTLVKFLKAFVARVL